MILTKRKFACTVVDSGSTSTREISLIDLISLGDNAAEAYYAMQDIADEIMDLKVGEAMYFQPIRDDKTSKGIISRIS